MDDALGNDPDFFSLQISEARRFHRDLAPARNAPLTVISGGCEYCTPDYEIHRKSFPCFGIELVAQGKGSLKIAGNHYDLVAGTLFAYGPGIAQDIATDPNQLLVKYFVDFSGKRAEALLNELGPAPGQVIQTSNPREVVSIFDNLIENGLRNSAYSSRITSVILEQLLLKIAETTLPFGSFSTPAFATFLRCRKWLDDRFLEIHKLEQIAGHCHIDPAYLCRLFRRFDRVSPYQYLLNLKMNHAARLLQDPQTTIKQVADELGFNDPFHFSRVFKKTHGIPPANFVRMSHRQ